MQRKKTETNAQCDCESDILAMGRHAGDCPTIMVFDPKVTVDASEHPPECDWHRDWNNCTCGAHWNIRTEKNGGD